MGSESDPQSYVKSQAWWHKSIIAALEMETGVSWGLTGQLASVYSASSKPNERQHFTGVCVCLCVVDTYILIQPTKNGLLFFVVFCLFLLVGRGSGFYHMVLNLPFYSLG